MSKLYLKIVTDTYFKIDTVSETLLAENEKILFAKNDLLVLKEKPKIAGQYYQVKLGGFDDLEGFFYQNHVSFEEENETEFKLKVGNKPTWFKRSPEQSFELSPEEKRFVDAETELFLTKLGKKVGTHTKVVLANPKAINSDFNTGFFYTDHLASVDSEEPMVVDEDQFNKVMPHILRWEGGCSDHPNDPGGRTFMGITTGRARQNGWFRDVCTMPKSMVMEIYKKDYWDTRPKNYPWPLNLAVMNTEVNSGGGRAQQFLERMADKNIQGSPKELAKWFVDQQSAFYRYLVNKNPNRYGVFIKGWLNRSNYMQRIIEES